MDSKKFIFVRNMMIHVIGDISKEELMEEKGYIHDGYVWVYSPYGNTTPQEKPIVTFDNDGSLIYVPCLNEFDMDEWSVSNIKENTKQDSEKITKDMISISSEMIEAMNNATSSYRPVIYADDDFLKRLVKTMIFAKNVNTNRLKVQMSKSYGLSNLLAPLNGKTKMSVVGFITWTELLAVKFTVEVVDLEDNEFSPLKGQFIYDSVVNEIMYDGSIYASNKSDDFLKRIIKSLIEIKEVKRSQLKGKMNKAYGISNLISSLNGKTKMSVTAFLIWVELISLVVYIEITDNGKDRIDPLTKSIQYSTETDKITDEDGNEFEFSEEATE